METQREEQIQKAQDKTKEKIKNIKESMRKAIREGKLEIEILKVLPDGIAPDKVHCFGYKSDGWIFFTVDERKDVAQLLEILPPVPLIRHKDGCLSHFPEQRREEKERGNVVYIAPVLWKMDQTHLYPREAQLVWWTEVGKFLIKVSVTITKDPAYYRLVSEKVIYNQLIRKFEPKSYPNGHEDRFWHTDDSPGAVVIYWLRTEDYGKALGFPMASESEVVNG